MVEASSTKLVCQPLLFCVWTLFANTCCSNPANTMANQSAQQQSNNCFSLVLKKGTMSPLLWRIAIAILWVMVAAIYCHTFPMESSELRPRSDEATAVPRWNRVLGMSYICTGSKTISTMRPDGPCSSPQMWCVGAIKIWPESVLQTGTTNHKSHQGCWQDAKDIWAIGATKIWPESVLQTGTANSDGLHNDAKDCRGTRVRCVA